MSLGVQISYFAVDFFVSRTFSAAYTLDPLVQVLAPFYKYK